MSEDVTRLGAALAGRYRIERELGEGGMATVYLAYDVKHGRKVALKVLRSELAAALGADRFLVEIKTTANLQHPHVVSLHDSGEADGFLFYVMPFIEGESLRDRLQREHLLPSTTRCRSLAKSRTPSIMRINRAWCIATSNPRTSCFRAATPWSRTSASRSPCSRQARPA